MIPTDIKLLNQLHANDDIRTVEELIKKFKDRHAVVMESLNTDPIPESWRGADRDTAVLEILAPFNIYAVLSIGIYEGFHAKEMAILNNALFTYNRLKYYKHKINQSGYDHCIYFENSIESFAGNDIALVRNMFQPELGLSKNGHRFLVAGANLIMTMLWDNAELKEESQKGAAKFLTRKNGRTDDLCVNYLLAIMNQDMAKASEYLAESCQLYKKNGFVHNFRNPFLKVFGVLIHGMYNMAYHFLPADKFAQLVQPDHTVFWKEFADYNKATGFTPGKPFIVFEGELNGLNKIYE
jgi:hypothetical protein